MRKTSTGARIVALFAVLTFVSACGTGDKNTTGYERNSPEYIQYVFHDRVR